MPDSRLPAGRYHGSAQVTGTGIGQASFFVPAVPGKSVDVPLQKSVNLFKIARNIPEHIFPCAPHSITCVPVRFIVADEISV